MSMDFFTIFLVLFLKSISWKKIDQKMKQELSQLSDLMIISVLIFIMINFVAIGKGVNRVSDISALH